MLAISDVLSTKVHRSMIGLTQLLQYLTAENGYFNVHALTILS
jgi:hypothetical protein